MYRSFCSGTQQESTGSKIIVLEFSPKHDTYLIKKKNVNIILGNHIDSNPCVQIIMSASSDQLANSIVITKKNRSCVFIQYWLSVKVSFRLKKSFNTLNQLIEQYQSEKFMNGVMPSKFIRFIAGTEVIKNCVRSQRLLRPMYIRLKNSH